MDPLTLGILAVIAGFASSSGAVEYLGRRAAHPRTRQNWLEGETFEDFYPASARGEIEVSWGKKLYQGRKVAWVGDPGEMVAADPHYMMHLDGNLFDDRKLRAVVQGVRNASVENPVVFYAPYAQFTKIGRDEVEESLQYGDDVNQGRALTTGDDEVDRFLQDPFEFDEEERTELEERLEELIEDEAGDLGKWRATVRDGNHRAFGAAIAGEPVVWLRVYDNDMIDIKRAVEYPERHTGRYWDDARELASMLR